MAVSIIERSLLNQRKWYIQPLDPRSSENIYKLLKGGELVDPKTAVGCPDNNGYRLCQTDLKMVKTLMEEMSLGGLTAERTDFGFNFFVYVKERDEKNPRFCFASTREMREENGKIHKERHKRGSVELSLVRSPKPVEEKPEPSFILRKEEETAVTDTSQETEKVSPSRSKRPAIYRISTHAKKVISLLSDELSKEEKETGPIPNLSEGNEQVWNVSPLVALAMKAHAKMGFLHFRIWKRDEKGNYILIGKYPRQLK